MGSYEKQFLEIEIELYGRLNQAVHTRMLEENKKLILFEAIWSDFVNEKKYINICLILKKY